MTLAASDMVLLPPDDRTLPRMLERQAAQIWRSPIDLVR